MNTVFEPIDSLPKTRCTTISAFHRLNINTYWDLLNHAPHRYEDYRKKVAIKQAKIDDIVTISGIIHSSTQFYSKSGKKIISVVIKDESGSIAALWFNQPYILYTLKKGLPIHISGRISFFSGNKVIIPSEYELTQLNTLPSHTARLVPVYPETKGLTSRTIREKIKLAFMHFAKDNDLGITDFFDDSLLKKFELPSLSQSYTNLHYPKSQEDIERARLRLGCNELFLYQYYSNLLKKKLKKQSLANKLISNTVTENQIASFIKNLPFHLTKDQEKAVGEILSDMKRDLPMNRFLQGDVGSGKTIVAAIACYFSALNQLKSLYMAPTEILAMQHYDTFNTLFSSNRNVKIGLLTSSHKENPKKLQSYDIIIGTHALLSQKELYEKVGLAIVDEQHRFGVLQRSVLSDLTTHPHMLTMTATPIPRTVALLFFGELDMSIIQEMPQNRKPVKTYVVPAQKREKGYEWIEKQIKTDHVQAFVICPLIEEGNDESTASIKAVTIEYERLQKDIFPHLRLGLIHGKMKSSEKDSVMKKFSQNKLDILVATSLVEVGIDIPNATIMIIESAQRFGLAQLHQLRGRVGRGNKQSYCFLFTDDESEQDVPRLSFFAKHTNGLELAAFDMKERGAGTLFHTRQHGDMGLKFANIFDLALIEKTKTIVQTYEPTKQQREFIDKLLQTFVHEKAINN